MLICVLFGLLRQVSPKKDPGRLSPSFEVVMPHCGSSMSPTSNIQNVAEILAGGLKLPLGKYLLVPRTQCYTKHRLEWFKDEPIGNLGGPWCFLQLWLTLYTSTAMNLDLQSLEFPGNYADEAPPSRCRCTSLGEATSAAPDQKLTDDSLVSWFRGFYKGLNREGILWLSYLNMDDFEDPYVFRVDSPMKDEKSAKVFVSCISPCILPTGICVVSWSHQLSYEFYYPSAGASQMGLGQLPIGLFYSDKVKARAAISSSIEYTWILGLNHNLPLGDFAYVNLDPSCTKQFWSWWLELEWKKHLLCWNTTIYFSWMNLADPIAVLLFLPCSTLSFSNAN